MVNQLEKDLNLKKKDHSELDLWYIIRLKPHSEKIAEVSLKRFGIRTYLPVLLTSNSRQPTLKSVPLFPGYLFFQLDLESNYWPYIRWAPGISYVLKTDQGPTELPAELINEIKARELLQHEVKLARVKEPFKQKEQLRVVSGPFTGLDAIFEKPLSASGRVQVLIDILGKLTQINLDIGALSRS